MISVTILTKNNQDTLKKTLESLQTFNEIIVYDTGSSDETLRVASTFPNVKVIQGLFDGFGPTHNTASSLALHDWILSIDSDEVLTPKLVQEIHQLSLDPTCVYQIPRHNYYNDTWIKWCGGWYPDPVIRLYNRQSTSFSLDAVHEKVLIDNHKIITLASPLLHTPYRSIDDFLTKMQTYSSLFASQHQGTKTPSLGKAIFHGWFAFFKSYILKRGFLGGKEGFIISTYNGHTAFYKYLKLIDQHQKLGR